MEAYCTTFSVSKKLETTQQPSFTYDSMQYYISTQWNTIVIKISRLCVLVFTEFSFITLVFLKTMFTFLTLYYKILLDL